MYRRFDKLVPRQSENCTFSILVDGITVYLVDLNTIPPNTSISDSTAGFVPGGDSNITFVEWCPAGAPFPLLDIEGLVLVQAVDVVVVSSPALVLPNVVRKHV